MINLTRLSWKGKCQAECQRMVAFQRQKEEGTSNIQDDDK